MDKTRSEKLNRSTRVDKKREVMAEERLKKLKELMEKRENEEKDAAEKLKEQLELELPI
jgi:hypothetical protein